MADFVLCVECALRATAVVNASGLPDPRRSRGTHRRAVASPLPHPAARLRLPVHKHDCVIVRGVRESAADPSCLRACLRASSGGALGLALLLLATVTTGVLAALPSAERAALNDIYTNMGGSSWLRKDGWSTSAAALDPCDTFWFGVECKLNHVV
jgi:hypothetical protein